MRFPRRFYCLVIQLFLPVVGIEARCVLGFAGSDRIVDSVLQRFGQVVKGLLQVLGQAVQPLAVGWEVYGSWFPPPPCPIARSGDGAAGQPFSCVPISAKRQGRHAMLPRWTE
jgi:hypothetical protein